MNSKLLNSIKNAHKALAVLIDPDKMELKKVYGFISKVNQSIATHIFVGGSTVEDNVTEILVDEIKKYTNLPIVLFPGHPNQIADNADGILFLSLISGRNPDYLIGKHVEAVSKLSKTDLEVIPTGYVLIDGGNVTSVERVSKTGPIAQTEIETIINTAKAGQFLGMQLMYLEAGSGANTPISSDIILKVKEVLHIPLIVGGGIRTKKELHLAYDSGADLVVIGNAFEENDDFFDEIKSTLSCGHFPKGKN